MSLSKLNFPILMLCLLVVLTLGYGIVTTTYRYSELSSPRTDALATYDVMAPPPAHPAAPPSMPAPPRTTSFSAGPDVSPTAAPGVAFNYRYAFQLPAERIAEVQEQHARACEQLGVGRCRITAMRYRVADDRNVEAMLALKLEPGIARRFGRSGTEAVARAEGKLIESDIFGTDAGAAIGSATRSIARIREDLRRLEQRLAGRGLSAEERSSLDYEAQQLRRSISAAEAGRDDERESLAGTPLMFNYVSGDMAAARATLSLGGATERAFGNFASGMTIVMIVAVTLLPWVLLALAGWWIARWIGRRIRPPAGRTDPLPSAA